jgi:hypothetical protein
MGKRAGRLCLIHQISFDDGDKLRYSARNDTDIQGEVDNIDDFHKAVTAILGSYKTDRIEVALKRFSLVDANLSGICIKSFPKSALTARLLSILNLCLGGENGTDFLNLPYPGTIFQQPNILIEAYYIFVNEINRFHKEKTSNENKSSR